MVKAIFWDRDGVINYAVQRETEVTSPWKLDEFHFVPGIQEAMEEAKKEGFLNLIVTNQPDVYRQRMSQEELNKIHDKIKHFMPVDNLLYAEIKGGPNYKPNNGMITQLIYKHKVNPRKSFMIGDRWKDIVPAFYSGLTSIYISTQFILAGTTKKHIWTSYKCPEDEFRHIFPMYSASDPADAMYLIQNIKG